MKFFYSRFTAYLLSFFASTKILWAQQPTASVDAFVESASTSEQGMSLLQVLQAGGIVMIILGILSMIMLSIVFFLSLKLNAKRMVPEQFTESLIQDLENHRFESAKTLCEGNNSFISAIFENGLNKKASRQKQTEAIENTARAEVSALWTQLNYLSEIAQVAPMLGLLGTVLGMIQAFNTIAFDAAGVKPLLLAGGVSKAMVTTAAGLSIAIVTIIFYSLLRARVQRITDLIEGKVTQVIDVMIQTDSRN